MESQLLHLENAPAGMKPGGRKPDPLDEVLGRVPGAHTPCADLVTHIHRTTISLMTLPPLDCKAAPLGISVSGT